MLAGHRPLDVSAEERPERPRSGALWQTVLLGLVLIAAVQVAGAPLLDAPWVLGDEFKFIARNPEVTGDGLADDSPWQRWRLIFRFPPTEDLYQPLPILTYAAEWRLWDQSALGVRRTDLLLHALNALLFWWVLRGFLAMTAPAVPANTRTALSWALALVWALHPALVSTYAADMGRTHLMSATFALLSLGLYERGMRGGGIGTVVGSLAALAAAMLCKPVPGWLLLIFALEAARSNVRGALVRPRLYAVAALCALFAATTYWTSARSGVAQEASAGLFGDPVSRSALAVWIYFRDLVAPFWLSTWHLPDPTTGWANAFVWLGLGLVAASVVHAIWAWRHESRRGTAIGWAWCWAVLLPVVGLVGAREAAATDRYLYQPLMGILLVLATSVARWLARRPAAARGAPRAVLIAAGLVGFALLLSDLPQVVRCRSSLTRARRIVDLNPGDPRALEALAVAQQFAMGHPLPADDLGAVPGGTRQADYFREQCVATLRQAAAVADLPRYFPGPDDRAPFHRRLSYLFLVVGESEDSLGQAQRAHELQPDAYLTWMRLAHAYHGLGRLEEALGAYARAEELLPPEPRTQATHFTDFGCLLLYDLERADLALPKFASAVATRTAPNLAYVGLGLCEIRVGKGARGAELVAQVLRSDPQDVRAALALAEYHLRSEHWEDAARFYATLVVRYPASYQRTDWYYDALRGFDTVCAYTGHWQDAVLAWDQSVRLHPENRSFRSFRVWALACAEQEDAAVWADELLAIDADNPMACLSHALLCLRQNEVAAAVGWVSRARRGERVPRAREFERCAMVVGLMAEHGQLPFEALLVQAAAWSVAGLPARAAEALDEYTRACGDAAWGDVVTRVRGQISDGAD